MRRDEQQARKRMRTVYTTYASHTGTGRTSSWILDAVKGGRHDDVTFSLRII